MGGGGSRTDRGPRPQTFGECWVVVDQGTEVLRVPVYPEISSRIPVSEGAPVSFSHVSTVSLNPVD